MGLISVEIERREKRKYGYEFLEGDWVILMAFWSIKSKEIVANKVNVGEKIA